MSLELALVGIESAADAVDVLANDYRVGFQLGLDRAAEIVREELARQDVTPSPSG